MQFCCADSEPSVDKRVVHVGGEIPTDFIPAVLVPVFHLAKAKQQGEQDGDTADGLTDVGCCFNVHDGLEV